MKSRALRPVCFQTGQRSSRWSCPLRNFSNRLLSRWNGAAFACTSWLLTFPRPFRWRWPFLPCCWPAWRVWANCLHPWKVCHQGRTVSSDVSVLFNEMNYVGYVFLSVSKLLPPLILGKYRFKKSPRLQAHLAVNPKPWCSTRNGRFLWATRKILKPRTSKQTKRQIQKDKQKQVMSQFFEKFKNTSFSRFSKFANCRMLTYQN